MKSITFLLIIWSSINYAQVGIGTTNPQEKLEVNGKIRMTDGNENTGKVMTSDANGSATWQDGTGNFSMISTKIVNGGAVYNTSGTGNWELLAFDTEDFDTNNEFDLTSKKFTALKDGYYHIEAQYTTKIVNRTGQFGIGIYINGTLIAENSLNHLGATTQGIITRSISKLVYLSAGNTIEIQLKDDGTVTEIDKWFGKTFFTIHRVR